jgi:hypothetical protein
MSTEQVGRPRVHASRVVLATWRVANAGRQILALAVRASGGILTRAKRVELRV